MHAGKLVTVRGLVMRAGPIRQLYLGMEYECTRCSSRQRVEFPEGATARPSGMQRWLPQPQLLAHPGQRAERGMAENQVAGDSSAR